MNFGKDGRRSFYQLSSPVRSGARIEEFVVGDIVLLKVDASRNQWPMTKVVQVNKDPEGAVRSVQLLAGETRSGQDERIFERPVHKIVLLRESEVRFPDGE